MAGGIIIAAVPIGIRVNGLTGYFIQSDGLRRYNTGRSQYLHIFAAIRMRNRQLQCHHSAHGSTGCQQNLFNAQVIQQKHLRVHHIRDGHDRELQAIRFARFRISEHRSGTAFAAAQDIAANNEVFICVVSFSGSDCLFPPANGVVRSVAGYMRVTRQRVENQDRVGRVRVQFSISLISQRDAGKRIPAFQSELSFKSDCLTVPHIFLTPLASGIRRSGR